MSLLPNQADSLPGHLMENTDILCPLPAVEVLRLSSGLPLEIGPQGHRLLSRRSCMPSKASCVK